MALNFTELIIGDDYLAANGRAIEVTFNAITGFTVGTCTAKIGFEDQSGNTLEVSGGSCTDVGGGSWKASIDITKAANSAVVAGDYDYAVEVADGGTEITVDYNTSRTDRVRWKEKPIA